LFLVFLHFRSETWQPLVLRTGIKPCTCLRRRMAWLSPSETGSESTARTRSVGLPQLSISFQRLQPKTSSWRGKRKQLPFFLTTT
jgi:hypothetical protein